MKTSTISLIVLTAVFAVTALVTIYTVNNYPELVTIGFALMYAMAGVFAGVVFYYIKEQAKESAELEEYYKWRENIQFKEAPEKWREK